MGLILEKKVAPSEDSIRQSIDAALRTNRMTDDAEADRQVEAFTAAAKAGTGVRFNFWRFLGLVVLAGLLYLVAVLLDWKNVVDDPKVYAAFAGTAIGALIGFIAGDAVGTATS